ncbi:MAG: crotonase/enoyl-CoA hydratase family protein [Gammaproteobacteria bacterium]|nr:MAG: crotonase/enoyl-CoA hydratase family protein [Gammaproteobacteria bacterium]|tara:strand:- start:5663 stop:6334 length:672 start_codon:yes stop_codon:yes gene_type:complete
MTELATLESNGDVSIITLDDGKVNVFSPDMIEQLNIILDKVPEDKGSILIQGKEGMFSAGFDLKVMQGGDTEAMSKMAAGGFKLLARVYSFPRPVVVACSGHAIALGAFLLCCADYRVGAKGEYIVQANEVRNNMSIPTPILEISKSRISKAHWYRAILNAEAYNIEDSIEAGYLDEVVEATNLSNRAMEVANDLATLDHPHYKMTKELDQKATLDKILSSIQ